LQRGDTTAGAYDIFNLGGSHPVPLIELIRLLEAALAHPAILVWQAEHPGDVPITCADLRKSEALLGYRPQVDIATGIERFVAWFQEHYPA
jgi:UDP-glucuronate 4-epimerase